MLQPPRDYWVSAHAMWSRDAHFAGGSTWEEGLLMKRFVFFISVVASMSLAASASAQSVTILGGGIKGQPYQFAVALSKILKDKAGFPATPQSTAGAVAVARLLADGRADFAFGLGGPLGAWAYKGEHQFQKEGPKKNLRAVLSHPFGQFQWLALADSNIRTLRDLKGKRVSVGSPASTTQTFARFFLPAHGLGKGDYKELTPGFSGGFGALGDGTVDAHLTMGLAPLAAVHEVATLKKIRLVDMDEAAARQVVEKYGPGLTVEKIPPGIYGKNQVNEKPVTTVFTYFGFSTSTHVSADVAYKVAKALFGNLKDFHGSSAAAKNVTLEGACNGLSFPLHEGVKRYFKEIGKKDCPL